MLTDKTNTEQILQATGQSINSLTKCIFLLKDLYRQENLRPGGVGKCRPVVCLQNILDVYSLQSDVSLRQSLNHRSACVAVFAADMTLQQASLWRHIKASGRSEGRFFPFVLQYDITVIRLQQSNKYNLQPDDAGQMSILLHSVSSFQ